MGRDRVNDHPLRLLFQSRAYTTLQGMNWLQERGHIADDCIWPEEVAEVDWRRVLHLAKAEWAICQWSPPRVTEPFLRL